ncbi:MAG: sugar-binding protein [Kiritimatiellia bacterium]
MKIFGTMLLLLVSLASSAAAPAESVVPRNSDGKRFVHPGIFYTQGDLDRMKAMVAAGREPWAGGFAALRGGRYSQLSAFARNRGEFIDAGKFNQTIGFDGRHAHDLALMWKMTGDAAFADKARDFLVSNSFYKGTSWNGTGPLDNGKIFLLIEAAELMRDYPGWKAEDQKRFGDVLRNVFYPHIMNGDIMRWGNQGLTAWHGVLAMAIFLDDVKMYDRVWNKMMGLPHRPDDAPYPPGGAWSPEWPADYGPFMITRRNHPVLGQEPDWVYDDALRYYIYANGQGEEACRDQGHAQYGLFQMVSIAEIFWNQGDDLYGALDNRILKGVEWAMRYNLSDWEPKGFTDKEEEATFENELFYRARTRCNRWTAMAPSKWARGADGGPAAPRTAVLMHYAVRQGLSKAHMKWTLKSVARCLKAGGEGWGFGPNWYYEYEGWGTLTKTRTPHQRGDPGTWRDGARVSGAHHVPGVMRAVDFDFHATPETTAHGTWHYPGGCRQMSAYRADAKMPMRKVEGRWALTNLKNGQWMDYTLAVPEAGVYKISVAYRSAGNVTLTATVDGGKPVDVFLAKSDRPAKASADLKLPAGAPVLRITVKRAEPAALFGWSLQKR